MTESARSSTDDKETMLDSDPTIPALVWVLILVMVLAPAVIIGVFY